MEVTKRFGKWSGQPLTLVLGPKEEEKLLKAADQSTMIYDVIILDYACYAGSKDYKILYETEKGYYQTTISHAYGAWYIGLTTQIYL